MACLGNSREDPRAMVTCARPDPPTPGKGTWTTETNDEVRYAIPRIPADMRCNITMIIPTKQTTIFRENVKEREKRTGISRGPL